MNQEKFRELLAGKIDSLDKWKEVCAQAGTRWDRVITDYYDPPRDSFVMHYSGMENIGGLQGVPQEQRWWIAREVARKTLGVYLASTAVMEQVESHYRLGFHFMHISKEDPTMVAYTPSIEDGLRDKQVRLGFGKMLRKLVLLATDTHIQRLEASHRSEMDPTFLVATTQEEIQRVYTTMAGDTGCMRYPPENWGMPKNLHPSAAYAYAGLGVAYTEVDGRIVSRSVIYQNPDDPTDKRYIRIYGDGALKRKLELAGYKLKDMGGAKLKAIDLHAIKPREHKKGMYLVPYIDGPAGEQGHPVNHGYKIKGEDCIRVISNVQAERLTQMGYKVGYLKRTEAKHVIDDIEIEQLQFDCEITGRKVNILEHEVSYIWHEGRVKRGSIQGLEARDEYQYSAYHAPAGDEVKRVQVLMKSSDFLSSLTFEDNHHIGGRWIATPENRKICGHVQLHEGTYGAGTWVHKSEAVEFDGASYKIKDCVVLFDAVGEEMRVPQAKLDVIRAENPKDYVQVAPNGSVKAVSHVKNPRLVTTLGKRRCVADWHNVVQLADGTWDYSQNVRFIHLMGLEFAVSAKHAVSTVDLRVSEETMTRACSAHVMQAQRNKDYADRERRLNSHATVLLRRGVGDYSFFLKGEMLFRGARYAEEATLAQMRAALAKLNTLDDQAIIDTLDATYLPYARCWQYHAALVLKIFDAKLAEWAGAGAAEVDRASIDDLLTATAVHIRDERFAQAA